MDASMAAFVVVFTIWLGLALYNLLKSDLPADWPPVYSRWEDYPHLAPEWKRAQWRAQHDEAMRRTAEWEAPETARGLAKRAELERAGDNSQALGGQKET